SHQRDWLKPAIAAPDDVTATPSALPRDRRATSSDFSRAKRSRSATSGATDSALSLRHTATLRAKRDSAASRAAFLYVLSFFMSLFPSPSGPSPTHARRESSASGRSLRNTPWRRRS